MNNKAEHGRRGEQDGGHGVGKRRVLIVDDGEDTAESLAALLEFWNYDVSIASEGSRALALASGQRPDVIVLDIGLPGMNGYELAGHFRSRYGQAIRLIAMTGYGRPEDVERAREAGFDVHLVKPIDPDQLRNVIEGQASA